jgi:hypothetical protein
VVPFLRSYLVRNWRWFRGLKETISLQEWALIKAISDALIKFEVSKRRKNILTLG